MASKAAKTTPADVGVEGRPFLLLPPEALLADDNTRYALKQTRIDALKKDITEQGEVHTDLEIENVDPPVDGKSYRVVDGHYRHAAVTQMNADGAGLMLPCRTLQPKDAVARFMRQLSKNVEREDMGAMDRAAAIAKGLEMGIPRVELRERFKRVGGRKGNVVQMLSNSMLNIYASFMQFPKPIRDKIADGTVNIGFAMRLADAPKDKWQPILTAAEEARLKFEEADEKADNKLLEAEAKVTESETKLKENQTQLEKAKTETTAARTEAQKLADAAAEAYKAAKTAIDEKEKEKASKALKDAEAASREANKRVEMRAKEEKKLEESGKKLSTLTAAQSQAMKDAREKANLKKGVVKPLGKKDADKAAAAAGVGGSVALTLSEIRGVVTELQAEGNFDGIKAIGKALADCFAGKGTTKTLTNKLATITGEKKSK